MAPVLEHRKGNMKHFMGDMAESDGMMFSSRALAFIDVQEERASFEEDRHLCSLEDCCAQVVTSAFGHLALADGFTILREADVYACCRDEFSCAVFELWMEEGQDFSEHSWCPDIAQFWDGLKKLLLVGEQFNEALVQGSHLIQEQVETLHDKADLQCQGFGVSSETEGGFGCLLKTYGVNTGLMADRFTGLFLDAFAGLTLFYCGMMHLLFA